MMDLGPLTTSQALKPPPTVTPTNSAAADEMHAKAAEASNVTAAAHSAASGDGLASGSGQPGLGEHIDLYDTQAQAQNGVVGEARQSAAQPTSPDNTQALSTQAAVEADRKSKDDAKKVDEKKADEKNDQDQDEPVDLLGRGTGLPIPTTHPKPEFPFLVPLGAKKPGSVIDAKG